MKQNHLISSQPTTQPRNKPDHPYEVHAHCENGIVVITRHYSYGSAVYEAREQLMAKRRKRWPRC